MRINDRSMIFGFCVAALFLFLPLTISSAVAQQPAVDDPPAVQDQPSPDRPTLQDEEGDADQSQDDAPDPNEEVKPGKKQDDSPKQASRKRRSSSRNRFSRTSDEFIELFQPIVASSSPSTAIVYSGRRQIAMGTIVGSDGLILTKASEMRGDIRCKLSDGKSYKATVYGVDPDTDLALLKIDAHDLPLVEWSTDPAPKLGRWVAVPDNNNEAIAVGVVSVNEREIAPSRPFIGIQMLPTENNTGVRINRVITGTPADRSGILVNDVVFKLDDVEIPDRETLVETIGQYSIGDVATLTVRRGSKEVKIRLVLADEQNKNPQFDRSRQQNSMGSTLSKRRKNFPLAFQHDSMLDAKNCGGPLVDLDGRVVGITIAHDGRVSSLALPRSIVEPVVERLKTGEFSPKVVNAEKLKKVEQQLVEVYTKLDELPVRQQKLERKLSIVDAKKEELERLLKDIEARLKTIEEKSGSDRKELKSVSDELKSITSAKRRLESKQKHLKVGAR